jgi:hypothetical protein
MKPQTPLYSRHVADFAARYFESLVGWWMPAGVKAPASRSGHSERDAEQRWEEEGGNVT